MKLNGLKETWDEIPQQGLLPDDTKRRMWKRIQKATFRQPVKWTRWAVAACAALLLSVVAYEVLFTENLFPEKTIITQTFPNDVRLLRLPDGTRVWINENSKLEYPEVFSGKQRKVTLTGEAFFEVKRDTSKPFIIHSGRIETTVLGTSFNIMAYNGKAPVVAVRTGKVKVANSTTTVFLERGYAAVFMPTSERLKKQKITQLEPEWKKTLLDVDGLTLEQVFQLLEPVKGLTITYAREDLKKLTMRGTLHTRQQLPEMFETLSFALGITITKTGNQSYTISD